MSARSVWVCTNGQVKAFDQGQRPIAELHGNLLDVIDRLMAAIDEETAIAVAPWPVGVGQALPRLALDAIAAALAQKREKEAEPLLVRPQEAARLIAVASLKKWVAGKREEQAEKGA